MKISESFLGKCILFSFLLILAGVFSSSDYGLNAASKKKKSSKKNPSDFETIILDVPEKKEESPSGAGEVSETSVETKLSVPKKKNTYFSKIDEKILDGIENGSAVTVTQALSALRKAESDYAENERVLMIVGSEIMNLCWPSMNFSIDVPALDVTTPYTGALDFARKGFFDSSTGNVDFLSSILPSFVLLTQDNLSSEVLEQCKLSLEKASEYRSDSVLLDYLSGLLAKENGDYEKAKNQLEKLYVTTPDVYEIARNYSEVKFVLKEYDSAYSVAGNLLEKNPSDMELLKLNARIAFAMQNYDMAETFIGRGLQQMPNNLEFLLFRAKILIEKNDFIHAVSLLDMYARQNDTNPEYLLLRARVQLDWSKNIILASETIEKTLSLYPDNKDALLLAARIASITDAPVAGKYADELVSIILESDPDNEKALGYALNALEKRSLWQSAYEISRKLSSKAGVSSDIISKHVEICLELGKTGEAVETATSAYEANPQDEQIVQSYILALIASGNKSQSLSLINSLLDSSSPKMKSILYYRRSFLQGTETASLTDLRSSLISNPRNSEALFRLYEIYFGKEDYKKAQYYLKQVVALNPNDSNFKKLNESLTKLLQ